MKSFLHILALVNAVAGVIILFFSIGIRVGTEPEQALRIILTATGIGVICALVAIATRD